MMDKSKERERKKIFIGFLEEKNRKRIRNYSECTTQDDYVYYSISPFANSCFDNANMTMYALEMEYAAKRKALEKCLVGLNMTLRSNFESMQQLIDASKHVLLKGNVYENFRLANETGEVNISVNITEEEFIQLANTGSILLKGFDYQNIAYLPKELHDRIEIKR